MCANFGFGALVRKYWPSASPTSVRDRPAGLARAPIGAPIPASAARALGGPPSTGSPSLFRPTPYTAKRADGILLDHRAWRAPPSPVPYRKQMRETWSFTEARNGMPVPALGSHSISLYWPASAGFSYPEHRPARCVGLTVPQAAQREELRSPVAGSKERGGVPVLKPGVG
jgi:hypothetical protein